jgi:hypothetical protein
MLPNSGSPFASIARQAGYAPRGWWRVGIWVWVVISVAAVVRRLFALAHPSQGAPASLAELDAFFASHATLTLAHILPALAFVVLVPFVIFRASAGTNWPEPLLYPLGVVVGLTAYAMSIYSHGEWVERSAVFFFNTAFLFACFAPIAMPAMASRVFSGDGSSGRS